MASLSGRSYNIHRLDDYFRLLASSAMLPNPSGVCEFAPAAVHRHYAIGHRFSVFRSHRAVLLQASSPDRNGTKTVEIMRYLNCKINPIIPFQNITLLVTIIASYVFDDFGRS